MTATKGIHVHTHPVVGKGGPSAHGYIHHHTIHCDTEYLLVVSPGVSFSINKLVVEVRNHRLRHHEHSPGAGWAWSK